MVASSEIISKKVAKLYLDKDVEVALTVWKGAFPPYGAVGAAFFLVGMLLVSGCRNNNPRPTPTIEVGGLPGVDDLASTRAIPVEVTQIVVQTRVVEITPTATDTPTDPKHLNICTSDEPESLYIYSSSRPSTAMKHVFNAIYEPLYTTLTYQYQPRGLVKIPSLADGDVAVNEVEVLAGDRVLDIYGGSVILRTGTKVFTSDGSEVTFSGEPLTMDQLVVQFQLDHLIWSDGTPVTAGDSVFGFEIAADPLTPVPKAIFERTSNYRATGDRTVVWTGIPGYLDRRYFTNVWPPLPKHNLVGRSAAELLQNAETNKHPLSYGPYTIVEWREGEEISFSRNAHYYLAEEGFPRIDSLSIKFIDNNDQAMGLLLSGDCDILTHDLLDAAATPALLEAEEKGLLLPHFEPGTVFEHIDFGINPIEEFETERPDWFEDPRVRQAIVMCTDRQALLDDLLFGQSELINAYVPDNHPLFPENARIYSYDVAAANTLLDEAGYQDFDEDGLRNDPRLGGPFRINILTPLGNETALQIAQSFKEDLISCDIEVIVETVESETYFSDGPESPLFGRRFDLAEFPWLISIEPNCALYLSSRIPGPDNGWNRTYNNETGFNEESFDQACQAALASLPGSEEYVSGHQEALRIWMEQVPIIPLFLRLKVAATRPEVANFVLDSTQDSELWNLRDLDLLERSDGP